jgi:hypothetical protein
MLKHQSANILQTAIASTLFLSFQHSRNTLPRDDPLHLQSQLTINSDHSERSTQMHRS